MKTNNLKQQLDKQEPDHEDAFLFSSESLLQQPMPP